MRKPEQSPEPSIEEILASIRRIIADDGVQAEHVATDHTYHPADPRMPPGMERNPYDRQPQRDAPDYSYERAEERGEAAGNNDILELTEDFMVEQRYAEQSSSADEGYRAPERDAVDNSYTEHADLDSQGLQNVLSNVAAEVDRLGFNTAESDEYAPEADEEPNAGQSAYFPSQAAPLSPPTRPAEHQDDTLNHSAYAPYTSEREASQHQPVSQPPRSRPVWSARRLETDDNAQPATPRHEEGQPPHEETKKEASEQKGSPAKRDRWAEGVQMPVPESGPAIPFSNAPQDLGANAPRDVGVDETGDALAETGDGVEKEKRFVGDFLTRVFGNTPKENDNAEPEGPAPESKAEALAKTTVQDFASDKLNAPSVAEALQADKPFMDQITDSLENALIEAENAEDEMLKNQLATAEKVAPEDLMEEVPPPPDAEFPPLDGSLDDDPAVSISKDQTQQSLFEPTADELADRSTAVETTSPEPSKQGASVEQIERFRRPDHKMPAAVAEETQKSDSPQAGIEDIPQLPQEDDAEASKDDAPLMGQSSLPANLEDSIKEMVKPLIVQWLNENLARIVEQAVREEVAERVPSELRRSGNRQH